MPPFFISEHYYDKRYKPNVEDRGSGHCQGTIATKFLEVK
jgi:hypothetical protein